MRFGMGYDAWTGSRSGGDQRPHRHRRDGEGRRRMFDGGELKLLLLSLIAEGPRHGYDLIREIEARTGGGYVPSPGVVYPTLTLLADMGLIEEQPEAGARKRFAVTEDGRAHLASEAAQVAALLARIGHLAAHRERSDPAPLRRARANLRTAILGRLEAGEGDGELIHRLAAILDEAAQKAERL